MPPELLEELDELDDASSENERSSSPVTPRQAPKKRIAASGKELRIDFTGGLYVEPRGV